MQERCCYGCMRMISQEVCPHCGWPVWQENPQDLLPQGTILTDRFLVGRCLEEAGDTVCYLGWDYEDQCQVRLRELFPRAGVGRDDQGCVAPLLPENMEFFRQHQQDFLNWGRSRGAGGFQQGGTAYLVEAMEPQPEPAPIPAPEPKARRGALWLIPVFLILVLAAGIALWFLLPEMDLWDSSRKNREDDRFGRAEACDHTWLEADCQSPRRCEECGEIQGEPLKHDWQDAACLSPEICARCGETRGEPLGHDWMAATVERPETCNRCQTTQGEPLKPISMARVTDVWATSVFVQEDRIYHATHVMDGDLSTAWVENAPDQGEGESLTMEFDGEYLVTRIELWSGYHKSDWHYHVNSRPQRLLVTFSGGASLEMDLEDYMTCQVLDLGEGYLTQSVTFTILSVYPGQVAQDTCVSEIVLY